MQWGKWRGTESYKEQICHIFVSILSPTPLLLSLSHCLRSIMGAAEAENS